MLLCDMHSHSKNSPDAKNSVIDMCNSAEKNGINILAITDHFECSSEYWLIENNETETSFSDIYKNSIREINESINKISGKIKLLKGIELGEPLYDYQLAEKYISDPQLDFVICSTHHIKNKNDFFFLKYENENIPELIEEYFIEVYENCLWNKFDVLGHLTYFLRYMQGEQGHVVDMTPYDEIIRECFKVLAQNGKGIEVNTSGYRQKYGDFFPGAHYVRMFKECGGEIITTGSDAHCCEDVGKGIPEAVCMIKDCGFKYITYFEKRKPQFIKIK